MPSTDPEKLGEQLSAYLDGELSPLETAEVERILAADPQAAALLESLRRTADTVKSLPRRPAPADLLDDLAARIERDQLLENGPHADQPVRSEHGSRWGLLASAAIVIFAVGGGFYAFNRMTDAVSDNAPRVALNQNEPRSYAAPEVKQPPSPTALDAHAPSIATDRKGLRSVAPAAEDKAASKKAAPGNRKEQTLAPDTWLAMLDDGDDDPDAHRPRGNASSILVAPESDNLLAREHGRAGELAELLNLEAKLHFGASPTEVLSHQFSVEPVQLDCSFSGEEQVVRAQQRVRTFALDNSLQIISDTDHADGTALLPASGLIVEGQQPRNFIAEQGEHQVLLRLPATALGSLVEELDDDPRSNMRLRAGGLVVAENRSRLEKMLHASRRELRSADSGRSLIDFCGFALQDQLKPKPAETRDKGLGTARRAKGESEPGLDAELPSPPAPESPGDAPSSSLPADKAESSKPTSASMAVAAEMITLVLNLRVEPHLPEVHNGPEAASQPASRQPTTAPTTQASELSENP
ncbi:MAG: hypothetical protein GY842_15465 [bacterium]|nr:hypothetical protein [bacterium]